MLDMNKMSIIELKQLREIADNEINNRLDVNLLRTVKRKIKFF